MRSDARLLLNKKKWNANKHNKNGPKKSFDDARKLLNIKRASKANLKSGFLTGSRKPKFATQGFQRTFNTSKTPNKQVQISNDGNLWITARSKQPNSQSSVQRVTSTRNLSWGPADVDSDNLEEIGIHDVINMESLPSAVAPFTLARNAAYSSQRSLADELMDMQNTMVADQVASTSHQQSAQVLVRNLCPSVSKEDILELFTDIGLVKNVEMTQPGAAVIDFFTVQDATQACEAYHNRLLDGKPMKCQLIMDSSIEKPSVIQRLGERPRRAVSAPSSASSSSNLRFRLNPSDVRFTVKL